MSEDMSDRMPEDLPVRKCINVMVGITRSKVIFLFGSFLGMDEINQTPRAGTALRNHNIEIRGR